MSIAKCHACIAVVVIVLVGCQQQGNDAPVAATSVSEPARLDQWIGRWNGPECTYLWLAKTADGYGVEIADLDGPKRYTGRGVENHIEFERDGKIESIHATTGEQTGMKWLQEKSDCLTVRPGEGFCRD